MKHVARLSCLAGQMKNLTYWATHGSGTAVSGPRSAHLAHQRAFRARSSTTRHEKRYCYSVVTSSVRTTTLISATFGSGTAPHGARSSLMGKDPAFEISHKWPSSP